MSKSQRLPTLLALAAATAISVGGVAAACPESFSSSAETTARATSSARYKITYIRREAPPPPLLERLGLFGLAPFVAGYGVTSIVCRRRRRRRRHD